MKKTLSFIALAVIIAAGCQQNKESEQADLKAREAAIKVMMDQFNEVMTVQDVDSMATFIAEDALICGSDPSEFFSKEAAMKIWEEMAAGPEVDFLFLEEQALHMAPDGNSAVVINQFYIPMMVPNLPVRNVYFLTKAKGRWMISLWSTSFIPKNDDLSKILQALEVDDQGNGE